MTEKTVTSMEEIRGQVNEDIITIPGFTMGSTINVRILPVDLTSLMLEHDFNNPLAEILGDKLKPDMTNKQRQRLVEKTMTNKQQRAENLKKMLPMLDAVCEQVLVEPTWAEFVEVKPLTMAQKLAIFNNATGVSDLSPFR